MWKSGLWLNLPEYRVLLDATEETVARPLVPMHVQGRYHSPWLRDLGAAMHVPEARVRQPLRKLARQGNVCQVVRDLFNHDYVVHDLALSIAVARQCD